MLTSFGTRQCIKKGKLLDKDLILRIQSFIEDNKNLLDVRFRPCLIHRDFDAANILIHNGKISGIFDMEWSHSGHNEYELSTIHRKIMKTISSYEADFFRGYESKIKRKKNHEKFESFYGVIINSYLVCFGCHTAKPRMSARRYINEIKYQLLKAASVTTNELPK